jgi:hypothetical protein
VELAKNKDNNVLINFLGSVTVSGYSPKHHIMHGKQYLIWIFSRLKIPVKTPLFSRLYLLIPRRKTPSLKIYYWK